jgi:hypothetical protein
MIDKGLVHGLDVVGELHPVFSLLLAWRKAFRLGP